MNTTTTDLEQQLIDITRQLLAESSDNVAIHSVRLDASLQKHLGIDSLGRAELFSRIEKSFQIQLPQQLLADANTLEDILKAIASLPQQHIRIENKIIIQPEEARINPDAATTLVDVLLLYAIQSPDRPHVYLQNEYGKEEIITYGNLLDTSLRIANAFLQRGLKPGDTIAIMLPTTPGFFYTFFGALLAGCIPVPIYPPFRPHQIESYAKQEAKILQNAEVRMLVTFNQAATLSKLLRAFVPSLREVTTVDTLLETKEKAPVFPRNSDEFALIQYTSGSTSLPKGVLLSHQNLLANIRAFGQAIQVTSKDVAISWAPLYHDLGLIGMWLGSMYHGVPLTIMSPLTFLTRPERWLWAIHYHRGSISGGPNFAYELCIRKIDPSQIEGLDLSSWRLAINGAEAIQPKTLERFTEKFSRYGFHAEAHFPVYGLAESTVCVATSPLNRGPRIDKVERDLLEKEGKAIPASSTSTNTLEFVACGKPIPNHQMRIVDNFCNELDERHIGHLQFKGPSSMQGYYGNIEATQAIYHQGWWDTGDVAYIANGEVFITGRRKDIIIKAGRNLYPAEIEELTAQINKIRKGCVIAFGITDEQRGTEKLIIVAETQEKNTVLHPQIIHEINEIIVNTLDITPDNIVLVRPQTIPKTSSGKLQRSVCKNAFLNGKLKSLGAPTWLQFITLGFRFGKAKLINALSLICKLIYTTYVVVVFTTAFPFVFLNLLFSTKRTAGKFARLWARLLLLLILCPVFVKNKKRLKQNTPTIYIANHTSYIDALVLLAIIPSGTVMVGKREIFRIPVLKTLLRKLNFIAVNRTNSSKGQEEVAFIAQTLLQKKSIMIFPEGTFSYATGLRPFKTGAFKAAVETQTPICPIAIQGPRMILRGEEKLLSPHIIKAYVSEPIGPIGTDWQAVNDLKSRTREEVAAHCGESTLDLIVAGIAARRDEL